MISIYREFVWGRISRCEFIRRLPAAGASAVVSLFSNFVIGISTKVAHPGKVAGNWDLDGFTFLER